MRVAPTMLIGFLVIAAPVALARDNGTAQPYRKLRRLKQRQANATFRPRISHAQGR